MSPDGFKNCLVQQQFIFDGQLRFAAEQPLYFVQLNSRLFSLGEYVLSPVQFATVQSYWWALSLRVVNVTCTDFAPLTLILHFFSHFECRRSSLANADLLLYACCEL